MNANRDRTSIKNKLKYWISLRPRIELNMRIGRSIIDLIIVRYIRYAPVECLLASDDC